MVFENLLKFDTPSTPCLNVSSFYLGHLNYGFNVTHDLLLYLI